MCRKTVLILNMAKGFGGGEFQTQYLIEGISKTYTVYFFGKHNSKIQQHIKETYNNVKCIESWYNLVRVVTSHKNLIIHAQDGRSAHIASMLHLFFRNKYIITRHVNFPLKSFFFKIII